ncbi:phage endopeptidase [Stenotrophomonas phage IME15]|uniref:Phage endopeptidase n=1 Tax=Stenotrophomonas phage IME15 TaxID=1239382 RepID=K4PB44_9CAUD|nr:Rz-like spanin [Stenotrophomonas phage IME15]AFV51482.1 phage endopeptidase [Stenotrophomonas phage IME15]QMP81571.1 endopeptidase [Aeromonas phage PZL-Ah1]UYD60845.1 spanin [Aeromonas phage avDM11-UST]
MGLLKKLVPWVFAGILFGTGWHLGADSMDTKWKQEVHREYVKKTEARAATQAEVDKISQGYQQKLSTLEGDTDRLVTGLRSDNKRLRVRIKQLSETPKGDSGCFPDGRAELDERDAKRILAVTQKGDAWIRALQETIRKLQEQNQ